MSTTAVVPTNPLTSPTRTPLGADVAFIQRAQQISTEVEKLITDPNSPRQDHFNLIWKVNGQTYCHKIELFQVIEDESGAKQPEKVSLTQEQWKKVAEPLLRATVEKVQKVAATQFKPTQSFKLDVDVREGISDFSSTEPIPAGSTTPTTPINHMNEIRGNQEIIQVSKDLFIGITRLQPQVVRVNPASPASSSTLNPIDTSVDVEAIYAHQPLHPSFLTRINFAAEELRSGNPLSPYTTFASLNVIANSDNKTRILIHGINSREPTQQLLKSLRSDQEIINKKTTNYLIPFISGDHLALLYFAPHADNPALGAWRLYDPTGTALPPDFDPQLVTAMGLRNTNEIQQDVVADALEDPNQGTIFVLRKIDELVSKKPVAADIDQYRDALAGRVQNYMGTKLQERFDPSDDSIHSDIRGATESILSNSLNTTMKANGIPPSSGVQISKAKISVWDSSPTDVLVRLLAPQPRKNPISPMIWSFAAPHLQRDNELQICSPFINFTDTQFSDYNGHYVGNVPLINSSSDQFFRRLENMEQYHRFAVGFASSDEINFAQSATLGVASVDQAPGIITLKPAIEFALENMIYAFLQKAVEQKHNMLIIPEFPIDLGTPPHIKKFLDEKIAHLFMDMLQRHFSEYDGEIIFAVSSEENRNPGAAIFSQIARANANFSSVRRLDHVGNEIPQIRPPVGFVHEENACFLASAVPAMILTDPLLWEVLIGEKDNSGPIGDIGRYLVKYQDDFIKQRPSRGISSLRRALHQLSPDTKFFEGQHDPEEVMSVIRANPTVSQKLLEAYEANGILSTESTKNIWEIPGDARPAEGQDFTLEPSGLYSTTVATGRGQLSGLKLLELGDGQQSIQDRLLLQLQAGDGAPLKYVSADGEQVARRVASLTIWDQAPFQMNLVMQRVHKRNGIIEKDEDEVPVGDGSMTLPGAHFQDGRNKTYDLLSFSRHGGRRAEGGHFIAYMMQNGKYYEMDDTITNNECREISKTDFLIAARQAYQMKYQLRLPAQAAV